MADEDEKAKAEKIAAARKRVAQLQKQKAKKAGKKEKKDKDQDEEKKDESTTEAPLSVDTSSPTLERAPETGQDVTEGAATTTTEKKDEEEQKDTAAEPESSESPAAPAAPTKEEEEDKPQPMPSAPTTMPDEMPSTTPAATTTTTTTTPAAATRHTRAPSLSQQSKLRSSSFRKMSNPQTPTSFKSPPLPPLTSDTTTPTNGGTNTEYLESAPELFRKQGARLEEVERENKRLEQQLEEVRAKCARAEEALEEEREANAELGLLKTRLEVAEERVGEVERLEGEVRSLSRQNACLVQAAAQKSRSAGNSAAAAAEGAGAGANANGSPSSPGAAGDEGGALQEQLASKESTIEAMQVEISNLKAKLNGQTSGQEQVVALEGTIAKLEDENTRVEEALRVASEKAKGLEAEKEALEKRVRGLEQQIEESKSAQRESDGKIETLEKKLVTLGNLHKDSETRHQIRTKEREKLEKEITLLKRNLSTIESENIRLREERDRIKQRSLATDGGDVDDAALDELEDEERQRLERRVRELEGEVFDLRRGVWREKRIEMQGDMHGGDGEDDGQGGFDDVDLMGPSTFQQQQQQQQQRLQQQQQQQQQRKHSSFATVLSSGLAAFTGQPLNPQNHSEQNRTRRSSSKVSSNQGFGKIEEEFLADDDDDDDDDEMFDEEAFARAQAEEDMKKRVEMTKEVKRGLKKWKGWRLDLVNARYGAQGAGVGYGDIFEI